MDTTRTNYVPVRLMSIPSSLSLAETGCLMFTSNLSLFSAGRLQPIKHIN